MKNNKSLGQHWLKNRTILDLIADAAMVEGVTQCLEIGPGLGTLTSSLLRRFPKVTAVEFDANLAKNLPASFPGKNLEVINADFLQCDLSDISQSYVVAANIPYYITSPIIEKLLTAPKTPAKIVLLIQKEVAERIAAEQGNHSVLSLFVQNLADVEEGIVVKRDEFTPPPKVDSEVIILTPHAPVVKQTTFDLIKRGFSAPRKKLISNLSQLMSREELARVFDALQFNPNARPADLSLKDWEKLAEKVHKR